MRFGPFWHVGLLSALQQHVACWAINGHRGIGPKPTVMTQGRTEAIHFAAMKPLPVS
jgi:hypothetical protein